jgi:UDP-N-acetylmuramoylalanine--D-glutamate ligase
LKALSKLPKGEREGGYVSDHSVFTNLEPDHLNWHADEREYFEDKLRMVRATSGTAAVNSQVMARAKSWGAKFPNLPQVRFFGTDATLRDRTDGSDIVVSGRRKFRLDETRFSGLHNAMNLLSCSVVANAMKICSKRLRTYLKDIGGLAHRLEFVVEKGGVRFVDDSKATSCQALKAALSAFPDGSVRLIAGGSDKGDPFEGLAEPLKSKVAFATLIGATAPQLAKICSENGVPHRVCESMDAAVAAAWEGAKKGQTVLLSPGCASFGMFKDYLDRAMKFREAVARVS